MLIYFSIAAIQARNCELHAAKLYNGQANYNPTTANVRYILLPHDSSRLYRKHAHVQGVNMDNTPEYNVDAWLDPSSPDYKANSQMQCSIIWAAQTKTNDLRSAFKLMK